MWADDIVIVDGNTIADGWNNGGAPNKSCSQITSGVGGTFSVTTEGQLTPPSNYAWYSIHSSNTISISSAQSIVLKLKGEIPTAKFEISYSADNSTFSQIKQTIGQTSDFAEYEINNIGGVYYLYFWTYGIDIQSIQIKDPIASTVPILNVIHPQDGDAFGYVTTNTTKAYTITNEGVGSMDVSISSDNDAFSLSTFSLMDITNDGIGKTFNVTFNYDSSILEPQKAIIKVTPTFEGGVVQSFEVSAGPDVVCNEDKAASWTTGQGKNVYVKYTASEGWNTISFPFAPNAYKTQLFGNSATLKSYALKSYDNGVLTFENASYLGAGTPYLIYAQNVSSSNFVVTGVNVGYTAGGSVTKSGAKFQGTFAPKTYQSGDKWYGVTSSGQVLQAGEGAYVKGYRAYFTGISAPTDGSRISIVLEGDGTTTDMGFVKMVDKDATDVYTLSGQKVQKAGKGLYIVNGRKVVIK